MDEWVLSGGLDALLVALTALVVLLARREAPGIAFAASIGALVLCAAGAVVVIGRGIDVL